jgi:hypothetical protein
MMYKNHLLSHNRVGAGFKPAPYTVANPTRRTGGFQTRPYTGQRRQFVDMKTMNNYKILMRLALLLLPLLGRGLGGGCVLFGQDLAVCTDKGYTLTSTADAAGAAPVTYTWYENGTPVEGSNAATLNIAAGAREPGVYAYVRMAGNAVCEVASNTYTVVVNALPDLEFVDGNPYFPGEIIITVNDKNNTGGSYCFTYDCAPYVCNPYLDGDGSLPDAGCYGTLENACGTANTFSIYTYAPGTLTVTASVTNGCTASITGAFTIVKGFTPGGIAAPGQTICSSATPAAIGSAEDAYSHNSSITYKWQRNGEDIAESNTATWTPALSQAGTYTRWAKDDYHTGWAQSAGQWVVTVLDPPAGLSLTSAAICPGETATLTADATNAVSYSLNGTAWQESKTFTVTPDATANYTLYA